MVWKRRCYLCDKKHNLHRFPVNEVTKKKWKKFCILQEEDETKNLRLCSGHFEKSCFIGRNLHYLAVPTILCSDDKLQENFIKTVGLFSTNRNTNEAEILEDQLSPFPLDEGQVVAGPCKIEHPNLEVKQEEGTRTKDYQLSPPPQDEGQVVAGPSLIENPNLEDSQEERTRTKDHQLSPPPQDEGQVVAGPSLIEHPNLEDSQEERTRTKKRRNFIGDFKTEDMECPQRSRAFLEATREQLKKYRSEIRVLYQTNRRLKKRIKTIQGMLDALRK